MLVGDGDSVLVCVRVSVCTSVFKVSLGQGLDSLTLRLVSLNRIWKDLFVVGVGWTATLFSH